MDFQGFYLKLPGFEWIFNGFYGILLKLPGFEWDFLDFKEFY